MQPPLPGRTRKIKWIFFISLLITIGFSVLMKYLFFPLTSGDIVAYEIAKTPEAAIVLINEWKGNGKYDMAKQSIYADYFFIILYTITLSSGALWLSRICGNQLFRQTGKFFSMLIILAGVFDVVENLAMMRTLAGDVTVNLVSLTYKMAISKFSIVLMTIFFMGICMVSWLAGIAEQRGMTAEVGKEWAKREG